MTAIEAPTPPPSRANGTKAATRRAPRLGKIEDEGSERALLGAMLIRRAAIDEVQAICGPTDFGGWARGQIYTAILAVHQRGEGVDTTTVAGHLEREGILGQVGGLAELLTLTIETPRSENVASYARAVHECAIRRRAEAIGHEVTELARVGNLSAEQLLSKAHTLLDDVSRQYQRAHPTRRVGTAAELLAANLPEPTWVVPGYLSEGLTLLAGKPKIGKSWMSLALGVAVSSGGYALGSIAVDRADVLYLAMEDTERRMQKRLRLVLQGQAPPAGLHFAYEWPRLDAGGLTELEQWVKENRPGLVIVDTLAKVRPQQKARGNGYSEDYDSLTGLKAIADRYGVAVIVVTHLRKQMSDDPIDLVTGTAGVTGAADGVLVLTRERSRADAVLYATGRDIEERKAALRFDPAAGSWLLLDGDAEEYELSAERTEILRELRQSPEALTLRQLQINTGKTYNAIKALVWKMVQAGEVRSVGRGLFTLPTVVNEVTKVNGGTEVTNVNGGGKG